MGCHVSKKAYGNDEHKLPIPEVEDIQEYHYESNPIVKRREEMMKVKNNQSSY